MKPHSFWPAPILKKTFFFLSGMLLNIKLLQTPQNHIWFSSREEKEKESKTKAFNVLTNK